MMANLSDVLPHYSEANFPTGTTTPRMQNLVDLITTLHVADAIANAGYLISSSELADLMDVNASAVTSRGDEWTWRNWAISRVRREGNQILWQLQRVNTQPEA